MGGFRLVLLHNEAPFKKPIHFPEPSYSFTNNPVTEDGIILGNMLFYDERLSRNSEISCGSCHKQEYAFADSGIAISPGVDKRMGFRNSPAIMNLAWRTSFFWDGNQSDLDLQPLVPITSHVEMDENMASIIQKLGTDTVYRLLFTKAFGSADISTARVMKALSQFMTMCISANSKYDSVLCKKNARFTAEESRGYELVKQKCSSCHAEPLFTDNSFRNNGLPTGNYFDEGRSGVTKQRDDKFKFRVPSLRNLSYTSPYMHDGRFATLPQVLEHYVNGIDRKETLDVVLAGPDRPGIFLNEQSKRDILAFLKTLDDPHFLKDPLLKKRR